MSQTMPGPWRRNPKPDIEVVKLAASLKSAADGGLARAIAVVSVDPLLQLDCDCAGDLDEVKKNMLIAGLSRLIQKLSK